MSGDTSNIPLFLKEEKTLNLQNLYWIIILEPPLNFPGKLKEVF